MARPRNTAVTSSERRHSQEIAYRAYRINLLSGTFNTVIRYGALVAVAVMLYLTIGTLAGRTTVADIGIKILGNVRVSEALAWLFGGGGVIYGRQQNKLRKDDNARLAERLKNMEGKLDRRRTSSKLTARGETNPGDKL